MLMPMYTNQDDTLYGTKGHVPEIRQMHGALFTDGAFSLSLDCEML